MTDAFDQMVTTLNQQAQAAPAIEVNVLIAEAGKLLDVDAQVQTAGQLVISDAHRANVVNALIAQQDAMQKQASKITKDRAKITDMLKSLFPTYTDEELAHTPQPVTELNVNGSVLAEYTYSAPARQLDTKFIEATFPDTPENAKLWMDKPRTRTFRIK